VAVTMVSDAFIVYRCFTVCGNSIPVIILPVLLFFADIATGILSVYHLGILGPDNPFYVQSLGIWVKAFYSITLVLNTVCTFLIAFSVWRHTRRTSNVLHRKSRDVSRVISIVTESGAVYSAMLFLLIGTYTSNSPSMFVILAAMPPIIGIVFSSIIVRVGTGVSHGDTRAPAPSSAVRFAYRNTTGNVDTTLASNHTTSEQYGLRVRLDETTVSVPDYSIKSDKKLEHV